MTTIDLNRVKGARLRRAIEKALAIGDALIEKREQGELLVDVPRKLVDEYEHAKVLLAVTGDDE